MKGKLFLIIFVMWGCCLNAFAANIEYAKVIEKSGPAEIWDSKTGRWSALALNRRLLNEDKIRTGGSGFVELAFDRTLDQAARLSENSQLEVKGSPNRFVLKNGAIFLTLEEEKNKNEGDGVLIETPQSVVLVRLGGALVAAGQSSTLIKVFSEKANVARIESPDVFEKIGEGFKLTLDASGRKRIERMKFEDYAFWQTWIKKHYLKKDEWAEGRLEKDFDL